MKILIYIGTIFLSLCTVSGVMIHGAHLDQVATSTHLFQNNDAGQHSATNINSSTHPHSEFNASTLLRYSGHGSDFPANRAKYKKYMLQNAAPHGRHAFDNTFLPLVG